MSKINLWRIITWISIIQLTYVKNKNVLKRLYQSEGFCSVYEISAFDPFSIFPLLKWALSSLQKSVIVSREGVYKGSLLLFLSLKINKFLQSEPSFSVCLTFMDTKNICLKRCSQKRSTKRQKVPGLSEFKACFRIFIQPCARSSKVHFEFRENSISNRMKIRGKKE